jgi:hypothetical protein
MARREHILRKNCVHEACKEVGVWSYERQKDLVASFENRNEYRCVRHSRPNEVLGDGQTTIESVRVSYRGPADRLYWGVPPDFKNGSGFIYGPGFKAFAQDFPEGTRLIISVRVETPNDNSTGEG